jgi:serine phosphatase RsbU (regulator of sigma subunit)
MVTIDIYQQRIQQLETELEEMTIALAQAWDQIVLVLQQSTLPLHTNSDIIPILTSVRTSLDAAAVCLYFSTSQEHFNFPEGVSPPEELSSTLSTLSAPAESFEIQTRNGDGVEMTWLFMPVILEQQIHGALGVAFESARHTVVALDKRVLQHITNLIESQMMAARLTRAREQEAELNHDLAIASQIQKSIQPPEMPKTERLQVVAEWKPAKRVGGDAWGWVRRPNGEIGFYVLDVSGKGLPAALGAVSLHTAVKIALRLDIPIGEVLQKVNEEFYDVYMRSELLATLTLLSIHPKTHALSQANAGHPPTLIRRANQWTRLGATTPPIGTLPSIDPDAHEFQLQPSDVLLIYSDGFTEMETVNGFWTESGLLEAVPPQTNDAAIIATSILTAADLAGDKTTETDDQTLLIISVLQ